MVAVTGRLSLQNVMYASQVTGTAVAEFEMVHYTVAYNPLFNEFAPTSDLSNSGGWVQTPIYPLISVEEDGTGVSSPLTPINDSFSVDMDNNEDFSSKDPMRLVFDAYKADASGVPQDGGDTIDLTVSIYQKATLIATYTQTDLLSVNSQFIFDIPESDRGKVIPPGQLSLVFSANTTTSGVAERQVVVTFGAIEYGLSGIYSGAPPDTGTAGSGTDYILYAGTTGDLYNGNIVVNYTNPGGVKDLSWVSVDNKPSGVTVNDGSQSSGYQQRSLERFRSPRYYRGDA